MKKSKFATPYDDKGRSNFRYTQDHAGIYLIKEDNRLVYVGYSGYNVYKTMHRHFQSWRHPLQKVISYRSRMAHHRYTVRVVLCTDKQAAALERALIRKHAPRDNAVQYEAEELTTQQKNYESQVEDIYNSCNDIWTPNPNEDCPFWP